MTSETFAKIHQKRPFQPFAINMADGRQFMVEHPEVLAYRVGGRMAVLLTRDGSFEHIDLLLVTSVTELPRRGNRRRSA